MAAAGRSLHERLSVALRLSREEVAAALLLAREVEWDAWDAGERSVAHRAIALRGKLLLALGLVDEACELVPRLERWTEDDPFATAAAAVFRAQLAFFMGAYRDAVVSADAAIAFADESGDALLGLVTRRGVCIVLGNLDAPALPEIVPARLALAIEVGDPWEEAIARNDFACMCLIHGDLDTARVEIAAAERVGRAVTGPRFALDAVLGGTKSQILLADGQPAEAAELAVTTVRKLERNRTRHPYLRGMTAMVAVQGLAGAGRLDEAIAEGRAGAATLEGYLPLTRSAILASLAEVLKQAGRVEEAFAFLAESVEIERGASRQFIALQHDVTRAIADQRSAQAEAERLRDEAERDWLTGLHNRRYLARLDLSDEPAVGVAVVDLDNFKDVNDAHGHETGDRVLARVAKVLAAAARAEDVVVRFGGDEFVVVMRGAEPDDARALAERLHRHLVDEWWGTLAPGAEIGTSVGYASGPGSVPLDDLIADADRHLYGAKRAGRGRVAGAAR